MRLIACLVSLGALVALAGDGGVDVFAGGRTGEPTIGVSTYGPLPDAGTFGRLWVTDEPMTIEGAGLDKTQIRSVLKKQKDLWLGCARVANDPEGRVVVFVVNADGAVASSKVSSRTIVESVGDCMTRRLRSVSFPKREGGGPVMVSWPVTFTRNFEANLREGPVEK
ncbi:MAG: hypothetical protein QM817_01840 [Archangium sp.]